MTSIDDCRLITLGKVTRREGNITAVEGGQDIPFDIARIYYVYDIPGGEERGGHAHIGLQQVIVSVIGSFAVTLRDGRSVRTVQLRSANEGLYVPQLIWRDLIEFSHGGICVVLASLPYDEEDYIREYDRFLAIKSSDAPARSRE
jgi:hypothetical protein